MTVETWINLLMSTKLYNTEKELLQGVLNHGPEILDHCMYDNADLSKYFDKLSLERLNYPKPKKEIDHTKWFMPNEYKTMDIYSFLEKQCSTQEEINRLNQEYQEFEKRRLLPLLRQMKYIVDTLRKNNIVWGVGRGSSVASYVLHLLGVHKINPIKYSIPINEFFKGEENG